MKLFGSPYMLIGILISIPVLIFLYFAVTIVFYPQIAEIRVAFSKLYKIKQTNVKLEELKFDQFPTDKTKHDSGDVQEAIEIAIQSDMSISERANTTDGSTYGIQFNDPYSKESFIFVGNDVHYLENGKMGAVAYSFTDPKFKFIRNVIPINKDFYLVIGDRMDAKYTEPGLYQYNKNSKKLDLLAQRVYFEFDRPPKVFLSDDQKTQIVVYYSDFYSFAFGGDSSRPVTSTIRFFNEKYSEGIDLVDFGLKAGVIYDVSFEEKSMICTGDPNTPLDKNKEKKFARKWKISWP